MGLFDEQCVDRVNAGEVEVRKEEIGKREREKDNFEC
jgi:hypothetical protein